MVDRCSVRGEWRGEKKRGEIKERPAGRTRERARWELAGIERKHHNHVLSSSAAVIDWLNALLIFIVPLACF